VKVLPKMSSSGGTSCFGVMVSVMESLEGSSPGKFLIEASSVFRLYDRRQVGWDSGLSEIDNIPERREHGVTLLRNILGRSMLSRQH